MLVYIASYPRSGTTWVGNLIYHLLGRRIASVYVEPGWENGSLVVNDDGSHGTIFFQYPDEFEPGHTLRCLVNGCGVIWSTQLRSQLASDSEVYFVKTHEGPFEEFLDGEAVIHVLRHPGSVIWSYSNFRRDYGQAQSREILPIIEGWVFPGSWAEHTSAWLGVASSLGQRLVPARYEEMKEDTRGLVETISTLTNLTMVRDVASFPAFDHWHSMDSRLFRSGRIDEWEDTLEFEDRALMWALFGDVMERAGYEPNSLFAREQIGTTTRLEVSLRAHLLRILRNTTPLIQEELIQEMRQTIRNKEAGIEYLRGELESKARVIDTLERTIVEKRKP